MKVYRIKLKGYELYYQPVKGRFNGEKSNLSKKGKVYLTKPNLLQCGTSIEISDSLCKKFPDIKVENVNRNKNNNQKRLRYRECDFEIVEYDCVPVGETSPSIKKNPYIGTEEEQLELF